MYILHYAPDNASLIVRLALEEIGAPYKTVLVDRAKREQDSAAYRALNPAGLIPALETSDGTIFETGAILLWLSERHGTLAPAPGNHARPHFLKWLFFMSNALHADMRALFYPERYAGSGADLEAHHRTTDSRIEGHLRILEVLAGEQPEFFAMNRPSMLTIYASVLLRWLALYPERWRGWFDPAPYPALMAIARQMETRPATLRAIAAEGLGPKPFTAPRPATPPEATAT